MTTLGVGFFKGAGIPKGNRVNTFVECGCCGAYHRTDFEGDCREDSERYDDLPDDAEIVAFECEECGHPYKDGDETHYPECSQIKVDDNETYWNASCDPCDPDNYWIDDDTGERVDCVTNERTAHVCPMMDADGRVKEQ